MKNQVKIIIGVFVFCISIIAAIVGSATTPKDPISYEMYVVKSGDTIDNILCHHSDGYGKIHLYDLRKDLCEKSNCGSLIYPGQVVYVPQYGY